MDKSPEAFSERSLGEILNQTFVIYGGNFWKLAGLAAVVHLPINVVGLVAGNGTVSFAILGFIGVLAVFISYGATVVAVGLQHFYSDISIIGCYRRAWWRVVSLLILGTVVGGSLFLAFGLSLVATGGFLGGWGFLAFPFVVLSAAVIGYLVYWSVAVQAVIFEGLKFTDGIRRSTYLIRGSWQRVFGMSMIVGLVVIGLFMLTTIPFLIVAGIVLGEETEGFAASLISFAGGLVVAVVTGPVGFIATTLIYFDLRTRKEGYGLEALSKDLDLQPTY